MVELSTIYRQPVLPSGSALAAAVRGGGPGGGQQRHVVVAVRVGDAEAYGHAVQKRRIVAGQVKIGEVVANGEDEFVDAGRELVFGEHRGVGATVAVGACRA